MKLFPRHTGMPCSGMETTCVLSGACCFPKQPRHRTAFGCHHCLGMALTNAAG